MWNFLRIHPVSMHNVVIPMYTQDSMRICSFCNFYHLRSLTDIRNTLFRRYATIDKKTSEKLPPKKKIKHKSKKYAELLEVTNQATSNTRAAVHKLNSTHVSALADQPDITLDKLHKITKNNKKNVIDNVKFAKSSQYLKNTSDIVEDLKQSDISNHTMLVKDSSSLNMLQQIKIDDIIAEKHTDQNDGIQIPEYEDTSNLHSSLIPFMNESDKFEDSISDHDLMSQLQAYIDIYIVNGMLQKAENILMLSAKKLKHDKINSAQLYNMLMEAYISHNMQLEKLLDLHNMMKQHSIQPNVDTYTLLFHMIAEMKDYKKQKEIVTKIVADMKTNGISFDDVMNTIMNVTRRNAALQCIRLINPEYQIQYRDIDVSDNCKLLQNLKTESRYRCPTKGVYITSNDLREMVRTQIIMERQGSLKVKSIALFNGNLKVKQQATNQLVELEKVWKLHVTNAFEKTLTEQKNCDFKKRSELKVLYPFLQVLPKEEYINAIMSEITMLGKASDTYSAQTSILYYNLGYSIYTKYQYVRRLKAGASDSVLEIYKRYLKWYLQERSIDKNINGRIKWQQFVQQARRSGTYSDIIMLEWPYHILVDVGKFLYNIIMKYVKFPPKPDTPIDLYIPAFYFVLRWRNCSNGVTKNNFPKHEIMSHPFIQKLYKDVDSGILIFDTSLLPMCSPPRPWIDVNAGSFLFSKANFVRESYTKRTHLLQNVPAKQLYPVFDSLNQLGLIPWKINQPILDILIQIFQKDGSKELNVPQPPSVLSLPDLRADATEEDRDTYWQLKFDLNMKKNEMYSLWCDCLYKLSLANHFRDKIFWLPHNLDFRGRAYPMSPHLTHLSSDLSRSILMFAEKKPLGPNGLDWLKIHTINLTGMKKREPTYKRLEYANEKLDLIIDSAQNPLTGKKWWLKSDEPWQTLAACKEIDNALQSSNVEKYLSGFPIHQDGSCNGLQHYAALGRDQIGAESVNLHPSSKPQDVYSDIAIMVEQLRKADAEAGMEIAQVLEGCITRKVIKQTVMTTVYGVTKFGAKLQIARQLNELQNFDKEIIGKSSLYLVDKTFKSLQTMFMSAKEIQDWFTECSRVISIRCNQYVQWVTPLGLPVLQPYSKSVKFVLDSGKKINKIKPNILKQKNAFPPNFIHSLDSCHMMLTSVYCEQVGITFISVHDCFWTHACTVDIMNKICREQFVALHSEPILEDLSKFFMMRYQKYLTDAKDDKEMMNKALSMKIFGKLPKQGKFDIKNVLSSEYFFS